MKSKILLTLLLLSISITGFCTTWTIKNLGDTFTPDTVIIALGDSVNFDITFTHDAREVSQATWNENGNTALSGGFQTPFDGGLVLPEHLTVGTHWYVCSPHAAIGMKGVIIVESDASVPENHLQTNLRVLPNPSNGQFHLTILGSLLDKNCKMEIYNVQGEIIYQTIITNTTFDINLTDQPNGIYFLKIYEGQTILTKKIVIE